MGGLIAAKIFVGTLHYNKCPKVERTVRNFLYMLKNNRNNNIKLHKFKSVYNEQYQLIG